MYILLRTIHSVSWWERSNPAYGSPGMNYEGVSAGNDERNLGTICHCYFASWTNPHIIWSTSNIGIMGLMLMSVLNLMNLKEHIIL